MKREFDLTEDLKQKIGQIPTELSILPLRDTVVFPGSVTPLTVGRESSLRLVNDLYGATGFVGVITQKDRGIETPSPDDLFNVGTVALVHRAMKTPEGNVFLIITGVARFRVTRFERFEPYIRASIEVLEDVHEDETTPEFQALKESVQSQFEQVVRLSPNMPDELHTAASGLTDAGRLADFVTTNLPGLDVASRQKSLEMIHVSDRLRFVNAEIVRELEVLDVKTKIQNQVQEEVGKNQREYYLREQLRAIQKELGETNEQQHEIEELRQKIAASGMTDEARKEADRELQRLGRMNPSAAEYTVSRTYLDWLVNLPWNVLTAEQVDIRKAREILDRDHYGLEKVKERILEYLAVLELKPGGKAPILCLVGPPGVGKTSLGRSVAEAMGRKFVRVSLGGMRDEAEIRGHRRTYIGALPGQIIQHIRRAGAKDAVLMLDEIDKLGADFRGDPASALLEVLDPEQNSTFRDHYLDVAFDLSRIFFITTANVLDTIPAPLRDRMEIIELPGYIEEDKVQIAKHYLVPRGLESNGLTAEKIGFDDSAIAFLVRHYTRETGVRNLEREISAICRKRARRLLEGETDPVRVTADVVVSLLGAPRFRLEEEVEERVKRPGVAVGLAWTPVGGDVLFVEANLSPGSRHLTVTGQVGKVMEESCRAALTWVRAYAPEIGITDDFYQDRDIHIHVPAGAIPKDGPSAGVTMATALISALVRVPIKPRLAMTGEITLNGNVLPVGGIKDKVLAARRAGISEIILPKDNERNVREDIQPALLENMTIHYVRSIEEVLRIAFAGDVPRVGSPLIEA